MKRWNPKVADKKPTPGEHAPSIEAAGKQGVGSTIPGGFAKYYYGVYVI
jgi:hypothetical protein